MIDLWAIDSTSLDPYQFRLMLHIARVGICWKGVRALSEDCNMSQGKVSTTRNWLEENGYIKKTIDLKSGKVGYSICEQWERSYNEQSQQNRSYSEQDRSPHEHQRSYSEQDRSPHELKTITKDYNLKTVTEGIYIEPDPEPIAELKTAISKIVKERLWHETEEAYDQAAYALFGWEVTPDQIVGFGKWWEINGFYPGKPALKSMVNEWSNYVDGVTINHNGNGYTAVNPSEDDDTTRRLKARLNVPPEYQNIIKR